MKLTGLKTVKIVHIGLQLAVVLIACASVLFVIFSEAPEEHDIVQNDVKCDNDCKTALQHRYFSHYAHITLPMMDNAYMLQNDKDYFILGCPEKPDLNIVPYELVFTENIINYSFTITYGEYSF